MAFEMPTLTYTGKIHEIDGISRTVTCLTV